MKLKRRWKLHWFEMLGAILIGVPAWGTNVYVSMPGTVAPQLPYTNWTIAATNIQDAIDAIVTNGGNIVYVSNGVYYLTNQVVITNGIELRSWNQGVLDQTNTVLHGNNFVGKPVTNRCVYMTHPQALVAGFTITRGCSTNNSFSLHGGGVYITNGGSLADCIITGNNYVASDIFFPTVSGGGVFVYYSTGIVERCVISRNKAKSGAGIVVWEGSNTVRNCTLSFNITQGSYGGGAYIYGSDNEIVDCVSCSNVSTKGAAGGGAGILLYNAACARNCLVFGNIGNKSGGGVALISNAGRMENCTVTSNTIQGSFDYGGGVYNWNSTAWKMDNSIVYGNITTVPGGTNTDVGNAETMVVSNSCSSVDFNALRPGINTGNITNDPQFAGASTSNYRLARLSPCVNTGVNRDWMAPQAGGLDLDGTRRIWMNTVDMGAYELSPLSGTIMKFH